MGRKLTPLAKALWLALGGLASAAFSLGVSAQPVQQQERVEITGSRILRTEVETSQPLLILTREDIQAQGLTSVGDVIQNITTNGSTLNTTFNNGGNGETRVSLRNLGSNRTLVLVNGRRWVGGTGLGGAVDLNTIPTAAVDRIEVLKDGASVIYGSDAIAGVVNIILRRDFDGAEANAYLGQFEQGDGTRQAYDLTIGASGQRFRSLLGLGFVRENPVMAGDREISAVPIFGTGIAFGSSTGPGGRFALCNGTFNTSTGTCSGPQTRPDGTGGQFTYDPGQSGLNWRPWTFPGDMYNFAPDNYLLTPQDRISLFSRASFDLAQDMRVNMQAMFNKRESEQLLAAMPIVLGTGPGAGSIARTIAISPDSIYNPFGLTVSRVQRRAIETGGRSFRQEVDTVAGAVSLEGSFDLAGRSMRWDVGVTYGRNSQTDTTKGLFNLLALRDALGPSMLDGSGRPVCVRTPGDLSTVIPGCVPMNLLGNVGSITQEMRGFSAFVAHDTFGYTMINQYATLAGDVMNLPGGPMAFAAGVERRKESGFDSPDALIASGNTTGNARTPTAGGYSLDEAFLELSLPVLRDRPGARNLEFTVATRHSDYSNFGTTTNNKLGAKWEPVRGLLLRANWSEGFRAPSILELFQGLSDSFPQVADPCSTTFGGQYASLTPEQQARCHAQGVPVGGYDQGNSQIRISVGGNPNLKPERSKTKTLGFVFSPQSLAGFDMSLDWWRIDLSDAIISFGAGAILDRCIIQGLPEFCALFSRLPGGQIASLLSAGVNSGTANVEGYDLTVNYRFPATQFGRFSATWDTTYLKKWVDSTGENLVGQYFDRDNYWRVRSNLLVRWQRGPFGATWGSRYFSRQNEDCGFMVASGFGDLCSDPVNEINKLGGTTYHDLSFYWNAPWKGRLTVGVNNAFDKNPPVSFQTFANSFDPQYEVPGRFLYVRYSQSF